MTDYSSAYQPPTPVASQPPVINPPVADTPNNSPSSPPISEAAAANLPRSAKPLPEQVVVEWRALSRPHIKRKRQYFTTIAILVSLISLILFFAGQMIPIAVVLAVGFLVYVLEMVPPSEITVKITTYGIRVEESLYYWEEMGRFWFSERYSSTLLHIEISRFPGRLTVLIGDLNKEALGELLSEVLVMEKPQPTFFEEASERLQKLIPLE